MTSFQKTLVQRLATTKNKKKNGFTLIELMVVIAIVGVLSAVGLPELLKAQDSAKDSVAKQEVVAAAKTCSMDVLVGGTSYDTALAADQWETVSGDCVTDGSGVSTIVGTSTSAAATTYTVEISASGIPGKPV